VLTLSHRILVLRRGRIVAELPQAQATQDGLLRLMAGLGDATLDAKAWQRLDADAATVD
jgi:ABC-type sugar transport system ATPase subunit